MQVFHESVMVSEVLSGLKVKPDDAVVDATLGGAGHFARLLSLLGDGGILVGIDADQEATLRAREVLLADRRENRPVVHILEDNFRNVGRVLDRLGIRQITKALFDLGWSGYQLESGRGFSFQGDEPLLMTYGAPEQGVTAAELVNTMGESELADLIYRYGEESHSRRIAASIVAHRARRRIVSTRDLVEAILAGVPPVYRRGRLHPATKTFQALRIAVNDEYAALVEGLGAALARLSTGGRIAVLTFHSGEDRIVKNLLRDAAAAGKGSVLTKKVITASREEVMRNPRARSAKLRLFEGRTAIDAPQNFSSLAYAL